MTNYIEFFHDQTDVSLNVTLTSIMSGNRVVKFPIVTKDLFPYDGWYTYFRYDSSTKESLLDKGKVFLNNPKSTVTYAPKIEKKIYKR